MHKLLQKGRWIHGPSQSQHDCCDCCMTSICPDTFSLTFKMRKDCRCLSIVLLNIKYSKEFVCSLPLQIDKISASSVGHGSFRNAQFTCDELHKRIPHSLVFIAALGVFHSWRPKMQFSSCFQIILLNATTHQLGRTTALNKA